MAAPHSQSYATLLALLLSVVVQTFKPGRHEFDYTRMSLGAQRAQHVVEVIVARGDHDHQRPGPHLRQSLGNVTP
jgi:hypothetical protein